MKTNPDFNEEDALLQAVLRDEDWLAANAANKATALQAFHTRQRVRRLARWGGGLSTLAALAVCITHWLPGPVVQPPVRLAEMSTIPPTKSERSSNLTDEQLLALFPKGSCFLAEVDGKKKLVFFDPAVEREYVYGADARPSVTR